MNIQHEFLYQKVVEGKSLSEAFRIADNTTKMKLVTIHKSASELSVDPKVTPRLEELRRRVIINHEITVEYVIQRLKIKAFLNVQDLLDENGELIPVHLLPRETAAGHTQKKYGTVARLMLS